MIGRYIVSKTGKIDQSEAAKRLALISLSCRPTNDTHDARKTWLIEDTITT